jgi:CRP/FNR family transcriptional regulator
MTRPAFWYFERFGLLQGLSHEQQAQIEKKTRMLQLKRGESVYLPGDPSESLYVVKRGSVRIIGTAPEGCDVLITILTPGDIFGELALTDDAPHDHRAEAAEESLLCEVPRDLLLQMVHDSPSFGLHVTKLIGLRLRTFRSRIQELLGKSAPARLAHALIDLSVHHGLSDDQGVLIPLRLSQSDLGKLVGLTRETVNGIIQVWREQGLVEMDRRSIRLRDPGRLRRVR